jgi:hypothetical protein
MDKTSNAQTRRDAERLRILVTSTAFAMLLLLGASGLPDNRALLAFALFGLAIIVGHDTPRAKARMRAIHRDPPDRKTREHSGL